MLKSTDYALMTSLLQKTEHPWCPQYQGLDISASLLPSTDPIDSCLVTQVTGSGLLLVSLPLRDRALGMGKKKEGGLIEVPSLLALSTLWEILRRQSSATRKMILRETQLCWHPETQTLVFTMVKNKLYGLYMNIPICGKASWIEIPSSVFRVDVRNKTWRCIPSAEILTNLTHSYMANGYHYIDEGTESDKRYKVCLGSHNSHDGTKLCSGQVKYPHCTILGAQWCRLCT